VSFLKAVIASAMTSRVGRWSWALAVAVGWVPARLLTCGEKSTSLSNKGTAFLLHQWVYTAELRQRMVATPS
jgi:hypothetical protein